MMPKTTVLDAEEEGWACCHRQQNSWGIPISLIDSQLTMVPLLLLLLSSYSTALLWVPPLATGPLGFVPSMPSLQSCSGSSSFLPLLRHPSNHRISPVSPPFLSHLSLSLLFLLPRCASCFSFAPAQVSLLPWHHVLYLLCFFRLVAPTLS